MDRIIIDKMVVHGIVGAKPRERVKPQALHITLTLWTDFSQVAQSDDLQHALDYSVISRNVYEFVTSKKAKLLEHLAQSLAHYLLSFDSRVAKVEILIQKPSAIALASYASVLITRSRSDFPELSAVTFLGQNASSNAEYVYLGLGTNLGNKSENIVAAITKLKKFCVVEKTSFLYETHPKYITNQPRFMNCVLKVTTNLEPPELLSAIKSIEEEMGRDFKVVRNGPRIIDIDILFYGSRKVLLSTLVIPHPQLHERDFVVGPLMDVAPPNLVYSGDKMLFQLWKDLNECPNIVPVVPATTKNKETNMYFHSQSKTLIMGILNVTPDSFSDGGNFSHEDLGKILSTVKSWVDQKIVDIIDIGGESTRPGSSPVSEEEELRRVIPVISTLRSQEWLDSTLISIDTCKSKVAEEAIKKGANIINDITAGSDPNIFKIASQYQTPIVLMHIRGSPVDMNSKAFYSEGKELATVAAEISERIKKAQEEGVYPWQIIVDPGIGFAKKIQHNLSILRDLAQLPKMIGKFPILIGTSRKRFIGSITHQQEPKERTWGTAATITASIQNGAQIIRVHDVPEMAQVAAMSDAIYKKIGYSDE